MPQVDTKERDGILIVHPVKADTKVCAGEIGCLDASGYLVPASVATGLKAVGRIEETVTGGTTDGEEKALVKKGVFLLKNSSADKVTRAHIESDCYLSGAAEVAATDGKGSGSAPTRSKAGKVIDVEGDFVAVKFD